MPTQKQKIVAKKILENLGSDKPQTAGQILKETGYSKAIIKNPKMVLESKGVLELFQKAGITQEKLAVKYNELLDMELKETTISADTRRKTLDDLSKRIIDPHEERTKAQFQFINKFVRIETAKEDTNEKEI